MREKKVVKKEKQQIYLILLSVMDEHKVISDHEVETEDTCPICQKVASWKGIIKKLDSELAAIDSTQKENHTAGVSQTKKRTSKKNQMDTNEIDKRSVAKMKIFFVQTKSNKELLCRFSSKKKVEMYCTEKNEEIEQIQQISPDEYQTFYLERFDQGSQSKNYVNLEVIDKEEEEGLIGKKEPSAITNKPTKCRQNIVEEVIRYDGTNHKELEDFCAPYVIKKTKRGNKVQISTKRGYIAAKVSNYVVRYQSRIDVYTEKIFNERYELEAEKVWRVE